jgi:hypothetical protein
MEVLYQLSYPGRACGLTLERRSSHVLLMLCCEDRSMSRPRHLAAVWSVSVAAALAAGGYGSDAVADTPYDEASTALSAETRAAGTAADPVFVFRNPAAGYSVRFPAGWIQTGSGNDVAFKRGYGFIHIAIRPGEQPSLQQAASELTRVRRSRPSLVITSSPTEVLVNGVPMVRSGYSARSARSPVTGKRATLLVDRYQFSRGGKVATIDLAAARAIDSDDAHRMIVESFGWI